MTQQPLIPQINSDKPVKSEINFSRDMALLVRHRVWGWNCPAEDIDFIEYDNTEPIALIEYKRTTDLASAQPIFDANLRTLISLGDRACLPVFITFYKSKFLWFRCFGVNSLGEHQLKDSGIITECKYVQFLYWVRKRILPTEIREHLNGGGYDE